MKVQYTLSTRCEEFKKLTEEKEKLKESFNSRLAHAGEQWQLQNIKAEKYAQGLTQHQRANFALRNGLNSRTKRIEELEAQLVVAREKVKGLQRDKLVATDAPTQIRE